MKELIEDTGNNWQYQTEVSIEVLMVKESCNLLGPELYLATPNQGWLALDNTFP